MKNIKIILTCLFIFALLGYLGSDDVGDLLYAGIPMLILLGTLLATKEEIFGLWWKFSSIFLLIAVTFLFFTGRSGGIFGGGAETIITTNVIVIPIFFLLSLAIIGWKSWRLRGK
ncbi:hypothetical protein L0Y49_05195 [bacterium]|nr:hypothetical protein [bacterium]MCI0566405.1 hypothetical protein [bacterium]